MTGEKKKRKKEKAIEGCVSYVFVRHLFGFYFRNLSDGIDTTSLGNVFLSFSVLHAVKKGVYPKSHLL